VMSGGGQQQERGRSQKFAARATVTHVLIVAMIQTHFKRENSSKNAGG
jgi:hypothetical protein